MSHVATLNTLVKDFSLVAQIAQAKGWAFDSTIAERTIYASQKTGAALKLTGWTYPVVIAEDGTLYYDHYHGAWGNPDALRDFCQEYTVQTSLQDLQMAGIPAYVSGTEVTDAGQVVTRIMLS